MQVVNDIKTQLKLKQPVLMFKNHCFRKNLFYDVCFEDTIQDSFNHLIKFINKSLGDEEDIPVVSLYRIFIINWFLIDSLYFYFYFSLLYIVI